MAFTAGFSVNVGDPTKASDVDVLAANDDFLKNAIDTFIANDANNRVLTGTGSGTANGEANLTFDGSTLALTGAQTISSTLGVTGLITATGGVSGALTGNVTGNISGSTGSFTSTISTSGGFVTVAGNPSASAIGSNGNGQIGGLTGNGLYMYGKGSTYDAALANANTSVALAIPTGGSATPDVYIPNSLGIGTTSPQVDFHVDNASTNGVARISTSHSSSYAQLQLVNQSGNYWYQTIVQSDNSYRLYNGSDRLIVDTSGNVDIGGDLTISKDAPYLIMTDSGTGGGTSKIAVDAVGSNYGLYFQADGSTNHVILESNGDFKVDADTLFVDASEDRVGINSASPTSSLTVYSASNDEEVLRVGNSAGGAGDTQGITYIGITPWNSGTHAHTRIGAIEDNTGSYKGALTFDTRGAESDSEPTERMRITSAGEVGVGTASAAARLHIIGSNGDPSAAHSGSAQLILENNANTFLEIATGASHYAGVTFSDGTATTGAVLYDHGTGLGGGADSLHFQVGGSPRAVINSSGDVGIGSLSPTYKLVVSNGGAAGYEFNVSGLNGGVNTVVYNRTTSAYVDSAHFALNYYIFTGSTPAEVLRATSAGEVWIKNTSDQGSYNLQVGGTGVWGAGAYVNGSDERLKKSIATYTDNALDLVNQMRPVTFEYVEDYSDDRATQIGFVAQDLQEVLQGKEYLDGIVKDDAEHLNVAYQSLIPVLTKAIQELTARIEALEAA